MAEIKYLGSAALTALATQIKNGDAAAVNAAKALIGTLKIEETEYSTVKAYVDAKDAAIVAMIDATTGDVSGLETDATDIVSAINELKGLIGDVDYSGKADKVASATAGNFAGLDAQGNLTDSGKKAADFEVAGAAAAVQGETEETVASVNAKITALVGDDTNKTIRTIANEELAAQLIAEGAEESLDTLKEIADWIQQHPKDASAMNTDISNLKTAVGTASVEGGAAGTGLTKRVEDLEADLEGLDVSEQIQDAIDELDLANTYEAKGAAAAVSGYGEEDTPKTVKQVEAMFASYTPTADLDTHTEITADEVNALFV